MAYSSGGLVQATDYNSLAGTIRAQWGTGSGAHGLGQSVSAIADVAAATTVTATQWTGLIQTINSCLAHEGQSLISPSSVTQGNLITYFGAITTGANAAYNNSMSTGLALTDGTAVSATYSSAWGTTGNLGLVFTHNIAFASGDAARYFFNAGGRLKLSFAKSGGSATTRNTEWAALATALGSIQMTGNDYIKVGGSGTLSNLQHDGYYGATTTAVQKLLQYDGVGSYSSNYISSNVSVYGTPSNGYYPGIRFTTYWINAWSNAYQDAVDGLTTTNVVVSSPATTYLANTWGTPTTSASVALYCGGIASGTELARFCSGTTLMGRYADGACGTYDAVIATNSPTCGYVPPPNVQTFDSSSTWTKPAGAVNVTIQVWGAGGGGAFGWQSVAGSGGGGGGGYSSSTLAASSLTSTVAVTVGVGGTGALAASGGAAGGTNGGSSSFGAYLSAGGGQGAPVGANNVNNSGNGGTGTVEAGGKGGAGGAVNGANTAYAGAGGGGAGGSATTITTAGGTSTNGGSGGVGRSGGTNITISTGGGNGVTPGGGGGGVFNNTGRAGNGASGRVKITTTFG